MEDIRKAYLGDDSGGSMSFFARARTDGALAAMDEVAHPLTAS